MQLSIYKHQTVGPNTACHGSASMLWMHNLKCYSYCSKLHTRKWSWSDHLGVTVILVQDLKSCRRPSPKSEMLFLWNFLPWQHWRLPFDNFQCSQWRISAKWWHSHFSDFNTSTIFLIAKIPINIIKQSSNCLISILIGQCIVTIQHLYQH